MKEITHRGKWLSDQIKEKGIAIDLMATALGMVRTSIYKWRDQPSLSFKVMKAAADFIEIDLRDHFSNVDYLYAEPLRVSDKYIELLEKHSALQEKCILQSEQLAEYERRFGVLPGLYRDSNDKK